jgi:hypothetical protein
MRRHRRILAGFAIVVVAVAACLPGLAALDVALLPLPWTLVPPPAPVVTQLPTPPAFEQPRSLCSLLPSRAPPVVIAV